jgi:hypothetical protein
VVHPLCVFRGKGDEEVEFFAMLVLGLREFWRDAAYELVVCADLVRC